MKSIIFLMALFLINLSLVGQEYSTVRYKTLKFFNESGNQVTAIANGDTLGSEKMIVDCDEIKWSIDVPAGDTAHFNIYYQFGFGTISGIQGYYTSGATGLSAIQDSIANNGVRTGKGGAAGVLIPLQKFSGYTSVGAASSAARDSIVTYTNNPNLKYDWVQIILIGYVGQDANNTTTVLSNNRAILRRDD